MIDDLKPMVIFVTIVETGSFRATASELGLSPSVVSNHISKLENRLGSALLYRSTRAIALTTEGEAFYQKAKKVVTDARDALELFSEQSGTKLVKLKVALPATMLMHPLLNKITDFCKAHPGIQLDMLASDQQIDLTQQSVDVAVRMGHFRDSDLRTRRIGTERRVIVAAPTYFDGRQLPKTPKDLEVLEFLSFSLVPNTITLKREGYKAKTVWGNTVAIADSAEAVHALARSGMGIAALPFHAAKAELDSGCLIEILPDWTEQILPISLTWPRNATLSTVTRKFIDFLAT